MANRTSRLSTFESQLRGSAAVKRHNLTHSETALWLHLAGSRLGVAFKRQVPVDRHIVDILAQSLRLVVEVDGLWHHRRIALDERRDMKLMRLGYRVLHLDAALVMQQPSVAVERVREAIAAAQQPRNCASRTARNVASPRRIAAARITTIPRRSTTSALHRLHAAPTNQNQKRRQHKLKTPTAKSHRRQTRLQQPSRPKII